MKDKKQEKSSAIKAEEKNKDTEIKELTETIQRLQADFENYKKRVEAQNKDLKKYAVADIITKLLPILDSFELALKNTGNKDECLRGVKLIYSQLFQTLEDAGLRPIETNGRFDPYKHEVLISQESDKEDNIILEELQKGYMLDDTVIRHSKVKVAKKKVSEKKDGDKDEKGASSNEHKC